MAGKRCYLCGGRLSGGRCVECGLDNTRNEKKTYRLNYSNVENKMKSPSEANEWNSAKARAQRGAARAKEHTKRSEAMAKARVEREAELTKTYAAKELDTSKTHIKEQKETTSEYGAKETSTPAAFHPAGAGYHTSGTGNSGYTYTAGSSTSRRQTSNVNRTSGIGRKISTTANSVNRIKSIGVIAALVITVIGFLIDYISDHGYSGQFADKAAPIAESESVEETDPYAYAGRELSAEGEAFSITLEPGAYQAGIHLPEGNYQVILEEGSGSVMVNDEENSIYIWQSMGTDEEFDEVEQWEDVRVYQGADIEVTGDVRVFFETENGQLDSMAAMQENPLTEDVLLKKGVELTAGEDFPAGVYDLKSMGEWTSVRYKVPLYTDYEEDEWNFLEQSKWVSGGGIDMIYHNVILPRGTLVTCSEDGDVLLTPAEKIATEDYDSFYDQYR